MAESVVADLRIWRDLEYGWLTINRLSTVKRVRTPKPSVVQRSTVISTSRASSPVEAGTAGYL